MKFQSKSYSGFSLIELIISIGILLIVTALVSNAFTSTIRSTRRERGLADRDAAVKRAIELITVELGQAGIMPDILVLDSSEGSKINSDISSGTTNITIEGTFRGFYPGRPIILGLPEGEPNLSETLKISEVTSDSKSLSLSTPTTLAHQVIPLSASIANGNISSPSLPNPFGILNPPLLTKAPSGPASKIVSRIGFVGEILGDGNLQYVEYSFENSRLLRSITPISESNKQPSNVLLDNVDTDVAKTNFTIIYPVPHIPVAASVRISITARSSVPEPKITGGAIDSDRTFMSITAAGEVMPRGTAAAAYIWSKGGEKQLRNMLPACSGSAPGTGFPPCNWSSVPWWKNVLSFSSGLP
jgi:type II secretory pathway pseudopilin PulG